MIALTTYFLTFPVRNEAPNFKLREINANGITSREITLSELRGKVIFLEFVAAWCPHCKNMVPTIKELYNEYSSKGVYFLTIAIKDRTATEELTSEFIKKYNIDWTVLFDEKGKVFDLYSVKGIPTYYLINSKGIILSKLSGEHSYEELAQLIEEALRRQFK
ncbi:MAG: TlpA disulfide reductase family protein [Nitrososphaerales archaeon]